jgi:hypothetical protein
VSEAIRSVWRSVADWAMPIACHGETLIEECRGDLLASRRSAEQRRDALHTEDPLARPHLVSHVDDVAEDAVDVPVLGEGGFIHEVDERLFQLSVPPTHDPGRDFVADETLARPIHVVQQFEKALTFEFGQRFSKRSAKQIALAANQAPVVLVEQFDAMVGTLDDADGGWSLVEQAAQARAFPFGRLAGGVPAQQPTQADFVLTLLSIDVGVGANPFADAPRRVAFSGRSTKMPALGPVRTRQAKLDLVRFAGA